MDNSFLLILVIACSMVSIARDLNMKPDNGDKNTGEVAAPSIKDSNRKFDHKEEILSFGDNKKIDIGAIMPSDRQQVSLSVLRNIKTAIIPSLKRDADMQ